MSKRAGANDPGTAAKLAAQRLAFGPILFQVTRLLRDLGLLAELKKHRKKGLTVDELAAATGISRYAVTVLIEGGLAAELVQQQGERYTITQTGYFVLADELTRVNLDFVQDVCYAPMQHLEEALREGRPAGLRVFGDWSTVYAGLSQLPEHVRRSWFAFDHYYSDRAFPEALPIVFAARPQRVMDIGGNTGKFAIACCRHDPEARVTILDHPGQLAVARRNLEAHGWAERVALQPIDFLDHDAAFPAGHQAIWMSQFLCCFGEDEVVSILARARAALPEDGRVFIQDTFWDEQEHAVSTFCLQMTSPYFTCVANGNSRMYTAAVLRELVARSGLAIEREHHSLGISHSVLVCRR